MKEQKSLHKQAYNHQELKDVLALLNTKFIYSGYYKYTEEKNIEIDIKKIRKAIWLCSILATSQKENHRIRAQRFATLLYLTHFNNESGLDILKICYVLFSRVGNLTATKFFDTNKNNVNPTTGFDFDGVLSMEVILEWRSKTIDTLEGEILATSFQKGLWNGLNSSKNLAISAPTSSGKSFIIKQYLSETFIFEEKYKVIYIVPSRALINQVSEEFRVKLKGSETLIRTAYIEERNEQSIKNEEIREVSRENKILYILTPERCIKLLTADLEEKIDIDFIFIDEIQGVEDEQGRGSTFENVFEDLSRQFSNAKLITAGPHILNPERTYKELFGKSAIPYSTSLSPVIQFKKVVRCNQNHNLEIEIQDEINKPQVINIITEFNATTLFKNKRNGTILERVINLIAPNDSNIIYSNRGDFAENWAIEYQESKKEYKAHERVKELIDFLKEEFHEKYYLIDCLNKGVAFHHGKLPDIIRKEVEELFQDKKILNLFCTSTLIEGVNLPANNLFILAAKKNLEDLTDFEFGNLIGRAGRLSESLYGTIYFLEKPNHKGKTPKDYFEGEYQKEITTFSSQNIPIYNFDYLEENINSIEIFKENGKLDYNAVTKQKQLTLFIRNKYIKDKQALNSFLKKKGIEKDEILRTKRRLKKLLGNLEVPKKIILENQSIDPLLQNKLYIKIKNSDFSNWVITPNKILDKRRRKEDALEMSNKDRPLFWQLLTIFQGLDEIFNLSAEAFEKYRIPSVNPTVMAVHATTWLQGKSYRELINDDIRFYSTDRRIPNDEKIDANNTVEVNKLIGRVIKINSSIVTYLLVKYIKLVVDILNLILNEEEKEKYKITMGLPTALELGTRDKNVRLLISSGISRTVAISVAKQYVRDTMENYRENNSVIDWLKTKQEIKELKPIYNRYLKRLKLLKD